MAGDTESLRVSRETRAKTEEEDKETSSVNSTN